VCAIWLKSPVQIHQTDGAPGLHGVRATCQRLISIIRWKASERGCTDREEAKLARKYRPRWALICRKMVWASNHHSGAVITLFPIPTTISDAGGGVFGGNRSDRIDHEIRPTTATTEAQEIPAPGCQFDDVFDDGTIPKMAVILGNQCLLLLWRPIP
jgi:hypothetical protein